MFAVDEALFQVIAQVREVREKQAEAQGRKLTTAELNAPLSKEEWKHAAPMVTPAASRSLSLDEANERAAEMLNH